MDTSPTNKTTKAAELVSRIRSGDQQAEEELVQRYRRGVHVIIDRLVSIDVDDLVQETFLIAFRNIKKGALNDRESLSGYICGIAKRLAQVHIRKKRSRSFMDIADVPLNSPNRNPLEQLLQTEEAEIVRQVLGELTMERDRQLLSRFYLAEEEKESICTSLNLTSTHFDKVIFRARTRFRELYEEKLNSKKR